MSYCVRGGGPGEGGWEGVGDSVGVGQHDTLQQTYTSCHTVSAEEERRGNVRGGGHG